MTAVMCMVLRADRPEHSLEAEPLVIQYEGDDAHITLDDGVEIHASRSELVRGLGAHLDPSEGLREVA